MYNEHEIERKPNTPWFAIIAISALLGAAGAAGVIIVNDRFSDYHIACAKLSDYHTASNAAVHWHRTAQNVLEQSNDRMRFINETYIHLARFFTNANVSEIEFSPNRIGTNFETNKVYHQEWAFTVTPSNVVAKKLSKIPAPPNGSQPQSPK